MFTSFLIDFIGEQNFKHKNLLFFYQKTVILVLKFCLNFEFEIVLENSISNSLQTLC